MKSINAFSLMDVLTVIAIMITLFAIGIPAYNSWRNRSQIAKAKATIAKMEITLERYKTDNGDYPSVLSSLITEVDSSNRPYMDQKDYDSTNSNFLDPWGNVYIYSYTTSDDYFTITSGGSDSSTSDDITNQQQW